MISDLLINILWLIGIAMVLFFIAAALAPLESLGWWAGWFGAPPSPNTVREQLSPEPDSTTIDTAQHYVVYLSGIGTMSGNQLNEKEQNFLSQLSARLPGSMVICDVFPYSVMNNPLTGQRMLAWFWRWLQNSRLRSDITILNNLIFLRNLLQVAVSADQRYGPIYSFGIATEIIESLVDHGYRTEDRRPITLIGLSGGGQIAVGSVPYLTQLLGAPVRVVSIGGVLTSDPGILSVDQLYHLSGSKDHIQHIGTLLYTGRWPIFPHSAWNRAHTRHKITVINVGPMRHMGHGDYLSRSMHLPSGQSFVERTVEVVAESIARPYESPALSNRHAPMIA